MTKGAMLRMINGISKLCDEDFEGNEYLDVLENLRTFWYTLPILMTRTPEMLHKYTAKYYLPALEHTYRETGQVHQLLSLEVPFFAMKHHSFMTDCPKDIDDFPFYLFNFLMAQELQFGTNTALKALRERDEMTLARNITRRFGRYPLSVNEPSMQVMRYMGEEAEFGALPKGWLCFKDRVVFERVERYVRAVIGSSSADCRELGEWMGERVKAFGCKDPLVQRAIVKIVTFGTALGVDGREGERFREDIWLHLLLRIGDRPEFVYKFTRHVYIPSLIELYNNHKTVPKLMSPALFASVYLYHPEYVGDAFRITHLANHIFQYALAEELVKPESEFQRICTVDGLQEMEYADIYVKLMENQDSDIDTFAVVHRYMQKKAKKWA